MPDSSLTVLFLCTHNSARSILAEATLNHIGKGRFKAFSAGSSPRANQQPNPLGIQVLNDAGIATDGLRSKSWDEFAEPGAPQVRYAWSPRASTPLSAGTIRPAQDDRNSDIESVRINFDLIITVCDNAAGEMCPVWPGHPATAHWGYADPSEGDGDDAHKLERFRQTLVAMRRRLDLLINLPFDSLEPGAMQRAVRDLAGS